jgi:hypothetical protein
MNLKASEAQEGNVAATSSDVKPPDYPVSNLPCMADELESTEADLEAVQFQMHDCDAAILILFPET